MRKDKPVAISLRKAGRSYSEIQKLLQVPKSTLSFWLKHIPLSQKAQLRINARAHKSSRDALLKRNKEQTKAALERAEKIRNHAAKQIKISSKKRLLLIGTALYWGEGYRKGAHGSNWKCVDFVNADPAMIQVMMKFFRDVCKVPEEKFRIQVMVHVGVNKNRAVRFWSKITRIPIPQFSKVSQIKSIASKRERRSRLEYGTVHIRIHDVNLFHTLIGYIDGLQKKLDCS